MNNYDFSVCMSVYKMDKPCDLVTAVYSIWHQTCPPNEIVLVIDGPITEMLESTIDELNKSISALRVIRLECNMGHAIARQRALLEAKNELCAIMDSDDISVPKRFEKQLQVFAHDADVSVVGGLINEFVHDTDNIVGSRIVPENDSEIKRYLKSRCPMNLVTVMLKKSDILNVGGFLDWFCEEDYYLWIRMMLADYKFYNIQENLVNVRVGEEMYQRRGGLKYFKSEVRIQKLMFDKNIISFSLFLYNVIIRWIVQVVLSNKMRGWVFQKIARK